MAKEEVWGSVGLLGEVAAVVVGVACLVLEVVVVEEALLEEAGVAATVSVLNQSPFLSLRPKAPFAAWGSSRQVLPWSVER